MADKSSRGGKRPGAGRPKSSMRDDVSTKVDRVIVAKAGFVAKARKITLGEYLDGILGAAVDRDFREESSKATSGD